MVYIYSIYSHSYPEFKVMPSNVMFCLTDSPNLKTTPFTLIEDEEKQKKNKNMKYVS